MYRRIFITASGKKTNPDREKDFVLRARKLSRPSTPRDTHKSVFVRDVVGQFQLVKGHHPGRPVLSGGRAVGVNVHALGQLRVGFSRHRPARVMELVPGGVRRHHVHQQHVARSPVQTTAAYAQWRKHPPHK